MSDPWRYPAEETEEYPGLVVHDGRVSGSITVNRSRLPLWAFIYEAVTDGWEAADSNYEISKHYDWDAHKMGGFLYDLLEVRGEFARLLLVLADAERCERNRVSDKPWWRVKKHRTRIVRQLQRCLTCLESDGLA